MKRLKLLTSLLLTLLLFSQCTETPQGTWPPDETEEAIIQLILSNPDATPISRGSIGTTPGSDEESGLATTLYIYAFDEKGVYIGHQQTGCTGGVTDVFRLTSGTRSLYVFSHPPTGYPTKIHALEDFETQPLQATFVNDRPTIATDNQFFIETLWRADYITIRQPDESPGIQSFHLKVGRAAAKIRLKSVAETPAGTEVKGKFINPIYTLQSIATRYHLVGQYRGDQPPAADTQVFSAVHQEGPGTASAPNPAFTHYTLPTTSNMGESSFFYAIENTTQTDSQTGYLYYGNTTHIHLKVQYEPDPAIVIDGQDGTSPGAIPADRTFWSARDKTGALKIFDSDPALLPDLAYITHYPEGWCHYYFPVRDPVETDPERRYCVIRNHFYDLEVQIAGLGTPMDTIDPQTPIDDGIDVVIACRVDDWTNVDVDSGNIEL